MTWGITLSRSVLDGEIGEPVIRLLQLSSFLGGEAAIVTREPGFGDDPGQLTVVLTSGADDETDQHGPSPSPLGHLPAQGCRYRRLGRSAHRGR